MHVDIWVCGALRRNRTIFFLLLACGLHRIRNGMGHASHLFFFSFAVSAVLDAHFFTMLHPQLLASFNRLIFNYLHIDRTILCMDRETESKCNSLFWSCWSRNAFFDSSRSALKILNMCLCWVLIHRDWWRSVTQIQNRVWNKNSISFMKAWRCDLNYKHFFLSK